MNVHGFSESADCMSVLLDDDDHKHPTFHMNESRNTLTNLFKKAFFHSEYPKKSNESSFEGVNSQRINYLGNESLDLFRRNHRGEYYLSFSAEKSVQNENLIRGGAIASQLWFEPIRTLMCQPNAKSLP